MLPKIKQDPPFSPVEPQALRFEETSQGVRLDARKIETNEHTSFEADALVLAASIPGSARIALRSLGRFGAEHSVPICTNAYSYVPCLATA